MPTVGEPKASPHAYLVEVIKQRAPLTDRQDLAWLDCEERRLRCELLKAQIDNQRAATARANRGAWVSDAVLVVTLSLVLFLVCRIGLAGKIALVTSMLVLAGTALKSIKVVE